MKVLIAGDFCPQYRAADLFENDGFRAVLSEIRDVTQNVDYSIVNFECPVTTGGERPIAKLGPNLQCSKKGIEAVKWAGFDCVSLANNHFLDYGNEGVMETLSACVEQGLDAVGGGNNLEEASKTLYKQIKEKTLAIINCCEHEFSIATMNSAGSNPLNPIQQYYAIKEAKAMADYVLVIVHGGHEYYQLPSPRMQQTYRFFVDAGADVVINHHQHCYSGYEKYNGKYIFYGLGNFCFDDPDFRNSIWNQGYLLSLDLGEDIFFQLHPYIQCSEQIGVNLMNSEEYNIFTKNVTHLNSIISSKEEVEYEWNKWADSNYSVYEYSILPYPSILIRMLNKIGIALTANKRRKLSLINYLECESHIDCFRRYIRSI